MGEKFIRVAPRPLCLLCGSPGRLAHAQLRDRLFGAPGQWDLCRCTGPDCGLVWLNPMPVAEDLALAYDDYYTHAPAAEEAVSPARRRSLFDRLYRRVLDLVSITQARRAAGDLYLGDTPPGRLLEVGCGDGDGLLRLKALGWAVEGQDIDPNAGAHSLRDKAIRVHQAPLENLDLPAGSYDAIVMNHVIEHASDPEGLLGECRRLLAQDGQLVLVTPNIHSFGHRLFGICWMHLDPPRHLFLYSVRTLPALAEKAGFSRVQVWSSIAHAGSAGVVSWDICRRGRHATHAAPGRVARLVGIVFQITAGLAIKIWRNCGEEAVLRAWK